MNQDGVGAPRVRLPMTSIKRAGASDSDSLVDASWYLTVLGEQARIALHHLTRLWDFEGSPPNMNVWEKADSEIGSEVIWSEIQGALFAGIVVSRVLSPGKVIGGPVLKKHAHERGRLLCSMLGVSDVSPLLTIKKVRDAFEHLDERMDRVLVSGDVCSVSDLAINWGGRFESLTPTEALENGGVRHVNMRVFAPDVGLLIYDNVEFDLWAWEIALHNLLAAIREISEERSPSGGGSRFGSSRPAMWANETIAERRAHIWSVRERIRAEGEWMPRPSRRPGTVDLIFPNPAV